MDETVADLFRQLAAQGAMIDRLTVDSRRCAPGVAFLAYPGEAADGRAYIPDALRRGAAAVVWESEGYAWDDAWKIPNAGVRGLRSEAGLIAHEFYGRPSESLWMCGVTGTNGKTSCTQWIAALLGARGTRTGVIGTLGSGFPGELDPSVNTTPGAVELQGTLADLRRAGASAVAMEVSSHALAQERVNGIAFDCALFTNLTHDHLDYHGTMEAYAEAKARLFDSPGLGAAVFNLDDPVGIELARRSSARGLRSVGYSLSHTGSAPDGVGEYVAAREIVCEGRDTRLRLASSWGDLRATVKQLGRFNLSNALGVLGSLVVQGVRGAEAAAMLETLPPVQGRMQALGGDDRPLIVVDYAHTPDALEKVLQALRPVAEARGGALIAVFGAGGDRDPSKRAVMGDVVSRLADLGVITSDNPRGEDPLAIIAAIRRGMSRPHRVEADRAEAIRHAVRDAGPRDVLLLAGKGHESYQEIAGRRLAFSDAGQAAAALEAWGAQ